MKSEQLMQAIESEQATIEAAPGKERARFCARIEAMLNSAANYGVGYARRCDQCNELTWKIGNLDYLSDGTHHSSICDGVGLSDV